MGEPTLESQISVLNVDDNDAARYTRRCILSKAGFSVQDAASGAEALRLVGQVRPQVVLLDVRLPDVDGVEVCRRVRQDPLGEQVAVVHVSAEAADAHSQVTGLESGADAYLTEPVDPNVLLATVRAVARARAAEERERRARAELERERAYWKAVVEQLPCGVVIAEAPSGKLIAHNEEAAKLARQPGEPAAYSLYGALHPDGTPYKPEEYPIARALSGGAVRDEPMTYLRGDGTTTHFVVSAGPVRDRGNGTVAAVSTFYDADELVRKQEALLKTSRRIEAERNLLDTIIQEAPVAMAMLRAPDFAYEVVNPAYQALAPGKPMLGRKFAEVWSEAQEPLLAILENVIATGEAYQAADQRHLVERRPGAPMEEMWVTRSWIPLPGKDGKPDRVLSVLIDTTRRKQDEDALRNALAEAERGRRLLDGIMEHIPLGIAIADAPDITIGRMNRYGRELSGGLKWDVYHSDGVTPASEDELPLTRAARSGEIVKAEEWAIRKEDGSKIPILCTAAPIRDSEGRITQGVVAWQDVTGLKRAEEALRASEARLARTQEFSFVMALHVSLDGRWLKLPPTFVRFLGYDSDAELLGKTFKDSTHPDDFPDNWSKMQQLVRGEIKSVELEKRFIRRDGSVTWGYINSSIVADENGNPVYLLTYVRDINAQKRAEEALQESERRYRGLFDAMQEAFAHGEIILDTEGRPSDWRYLDVNPAFERMFGRSRGEVIGHTYLELFPDAPWQYWVPRLGEVALTGNPARLEQYDPIRRRHYDAIAYSPRRGQFAGIFSDMTEHRRAEEQLRESERRYSALFANKINGIVHCRVITDANGKPVDVEVMEVNSAYESITGLKRTAVEGKRARDVFPGIENFAFDYIGNFGRIALEGGEQSFEAFFEPTRQWLSIYIYSPKPGEAVGIFTDISNRKRAEEELARQKQHYEALAENAPEVIARFDRELRHIYINEYGAKVYGIPKAEILGKTSAELGMPADKVELWRKQLQQVLETGEQPIVNFEFDSPAFGHQYFSAVFVPERDERGRVATILAITRDVTLLRRAEEALRANERQLATIIDNLAEGLIAIDLKTAALRWNESALKMYGYRRQEDASGSLESFRELYEISTLDGQPVPFEQWPVSKIALGEHFKEYELIVRHKKRDWERIFSYSSAMVRDDTGRPSLGLLTIRDITDRKRSEERLRQAQKLESVGLLASGIAHDFNNLLASIMGYASILEDELPPASAHKASAIIHASERAANLTRQLLAYAGKGQFVLKPVDVSSVVRDMAELLYASVPKKVRLDQALNPALPPIEADPGQVQQIVMNLVLNAAEAIPEDQPGTVAIRTCVQEVAGGRTVLDDASGEPLAPGTYVSLEVCDTGIGMDDSTKARIFDPFFTTKFMGRGLGLSAVAGIIRAHRGAIQIVSERGKGTTFRVYLPASSKREKREPAAKAGGPTVLVADDEEVVRDFTRAALESRGYRVLLAKDGREAIRLIQEHPGAIDVALLDLVMPVMGGREVADVLAKTHPGVPIVAMSGYSESEAERLFGGKSIASFLQKPFPVRRLAGRIEAALASRGAGGGRK